MRRLKKIASDRYQVNKHMFLVRTKRGPKGWDIHSHWPMTPEAGEKMIEAAKQILGRHQTMQQFNGQSVLVDVFHAGPFATLRDAVNHLKNTGSGDPFDEA